MQPVDIPFDVCRCELNGVNLIEASAGTGKTHALTGLYLRLVVEKHLTPQQILVITFTNAATAELKMRIRKRLTEAISNFQSASSDDELLACWRKRYASDPQRKQILKQIRLALADYDETAIHTIHGFCNRILTENAFESGTLFDVEMIGNQQSLVDEFVSDFWRKNLSGSHPVLVQYALFEKFDRKALLSLMKNISSKPDLKVVADAAELKSDELEEDCLQVSKTFDRFKDIWLNQKEKILSVLKSDALHKTHYRKKLEEIAAQIDGFVECSMFEFPLPNHLEKLTNTFIQEKTNKGYAPPAHEIFDIGEILYRQAQDLSRKLDRHILYLKRKFIDAVFHEFPRIKRQKNALYFNDLLFGAREALNSPRGKALREALREKYKAVLVDEFQDTDPVQYEILKSVFADREPREECAVFYVGDPKQAIYSFRGADVFAYLKAAGSADRRYAMMHNWRSEEGLIRAVNILFGWSENPFVYEDIRYIEVSRPSRSKTPNFLEDGRKSPAMRILFLPAKKDGEKISPWSKSEAAEKIKRAVVSEISRLLVAGREGRAFIGDKPLETSDIAVLVRTNSQASDFQKALNEAGIVATLQSSECVFQTNEAREMKRFLLGIAHPDDDGILLAALATPLVGLGAEALRDCLENDFMMEQRRETFRRCHDGFLRNGFLTMFYDFLENQHVRPRILMYPGGLRKITNYLHLAEEIHLAQAERKMSLEAVLRWFDFMLDRPDDMVEEHEQLRLEDDQNAVRIMTIHKSKGLEYGIVFCPFVWDSPNENTKADLFCFHDEENDRALTCDLNRDPPENIMAQWHRENLAEERRLLYVALTRAKNRCYFAWGNISKAPQSALGKLLFRNADAGKVFDKNPGDEQILEPVREIVSRAPEDIAVCVMEPSQPETMRSWEAKVEPLSCREFGGHIDLSWKIASFSYLTGRIEAGAEGMPLIEEEEVYRMPENLPGKEDAKTIFTFPRGVVAGSLLHEILEAVDFSKPVDDEVLKTIIEKLRRYRFEEKWAPELCRMVSDAAQANLSDALVDGTVFNLASVAPGRCLKELGFTFPISNFSLRRLLDLLNRYGVRPGGESEDDSRSLIFDEIQGFMKGFIDLVFEYKNRFYLLDWKSNYLGGQYEDYSKEIIRDYMRRSSYVLQSLIYTVALDKYLRGRVEHYSYENHFGGVYYVFLRGIGAEAPKDNGIYYERISPDLLKDLHRIFHP